MLGDLRKPVPARAILYPTVIISWSSLKTMPSAPWNTSWCPSCGAITVHASVSTLPWEDAALPVPARYLSCPRCEAVTVTLPPAAARWAHACLCLMVERTWSLPRLTALHGALGQARSDLSSCPVQSQRGVSHVAPYLAVVLAEAHAKDELEDCLAGCSLVLNMVLTGRAAKPARTSLSSLLDQLCRALEPLAQVPAAGPGADRRTA
ncbi:hypothetical protein [Ornithinicoccus halotolerans]|uniref:hypothetical protein n=1 Tax=Ornithinicoccus halotolerans TaxID=1748220 RepID=UPI001296102F|nr:hypothetical protein [Ornithinicoccus halotolerans]